jgi:hypothetical protein
MMKAIAAALLLISSSAQAADRALILTDQEQMALRAIFDAAIRQGGATQLSRNAFVLLDKLDAAGVVTEQKKEAPNEAPPK